MSRAARFVGVGAGGFVLQALTLQALAAAGVPYLIATAIAVEAAILHNFVWHERWTWSDRSEAGLTCPPKLEGRRWKARSSERAMRFLRFNGSTALVSVGGNLALMALLTGYVGLPLLPANLLAVVALSLLNFVAADRLVFTPPSLPSLPSLPSPPSPHSLPPHP